jgi:predicted permease
VALALAAVVNVAGWVLPAALGEPIDLLADACVPVMLLALGGSVVVLARGPAAARTWLVPAAVATKVAVVPLAVWAWVGPLGLWPDPGYHLVLAMAAPAAVMASQLAPVRSPDGEGDGGAVVERVIVWSTLLSCVSLPLAGALLSAAG